MKKGQIVKIILTSGETVQESIKKINEAGFQTKNYTFKKDGNKFTPLESGVVGCAILKKTTLIHKLTLGVL